MGIITLSWATPALATVVVGAMNVPASSPEYFQIFGMFADTWIEVGSCAMCPALYAIKLAILSIFN
jgi:hypothetical protein